MTKLLFIGDLMPHSTILNSCKTKDGYDYDSIFKYVKPYLLDCDYLVANPEFGLRTRDYVYFEGDKNNFSGSKDTMKQENFPYVKLPERDDIGIILISSPVSFLEYTMNELNVNQYTLANNHTLDCGLGCFEDFKKILSENNKDINGLNGSNGIIKTFDGVKVGFYNFTMFSKDVPEGTRDFFVQIRPDIEKLKAMRDCVDKLIILPHWGTEYITYLRKKSQDVLNELKSVGPDYIIGTHPHIVSPYCIGNLMCGRNRSQSRLGSIVRININEDKSTSESVIYTWCALPGTVEKSFSIVPVDDVLSGKINMDNMEKREMLRTLYLSFCRGDMSVLPILKYEYA